MKKRLVLVLVAVAAVILAVSCATSVSVKVTRPAELDMRGANSISVLPFQPSRVKLFRGRGSRKAFLGLFVDFFGAGNPEENRTIDLLTRELCKTFASSDDLALIDSNVVKNALEYNEEPPCDAYLTGQVTFFDYRIKDRDVKRKNEDGDVYYETVYQSEAKIDILYQVVDARTEEVIAYKEASYERDSSEYDRRRDCPDAYDLLKSCMYDLAEKIARQVQPYDVYVTLSLLDDKEKNPENKIANELADNGLIDESLEKYQAFYDKTGNWVAGYNAALLLQAQGKLYEAKELMSKVVEATAEKKAISALRNIQYEIDQAEKLQSQREAQNAE